MTYGHVQADCMYTGISSGPNAGYRVWESLYHTFNLSKERMCADSEFHVDGAEMEHAREVKLLVMPEGLARRWKVVGD